MQRTLLSLAAGVALLLVAATSEAGRDPLPAGRGALWAIAGDERLALPAQRTAMEARIAGDAARVTVTQRFQNPRDEAIEAVYVLPLPESAAVSSLRVGVGARTIRGSIRSREEAVRLHAQARAAGRLSALVEQERPNLFTQTIATIPPGLQVEVELVYDLPLRTTGRGYELVLPTAVAPRFVPGTPDGAPPVGTGTAPDTDRVPDASRVTPPLREPGDDPADALAVRVTIAAGAPVGAVASPTHAISVQRDAAPGEVVVTLARSDERADRDFVLRYRLAGDEPVATATVGGGAVSLVLVPPRAAEVAAAEPVELAIVLDTSGSMAGASARRARELVRGLALGLDAGDRLRLHALGRGAPLAPTPLAPTPANLRRLAAYLDATAADGATHLGEAIAAALDRPRDPGRRLVLCVVTDGLVADERAILAAAASRLGPGGRLHAIGVGAAVNRYLLEHLSALGRGSATYLLPSDAPLALGRRVAARIRAPAVSDLAIDWNGLEIAAQTPAALPDLLPGRPVRVLARVRGGAADEVRVVGRRGDREVALTARVARARDPELVSRLWARARIRELVLADEAQPDPARARRIQALGLEHGLVTAHTAFVALGEELAADGRATVTVPMPVELPAGMDRGAISFDALDETPRTEGAPVPTFESTLGTRAIALDGRIARPWRLSVGIGGGVAVAGGPARPAGAVDLALDVPLRASLEVGAMLRGLGSGADGARMGGALYLGASAWLGRVLRLGAGLGPALTPEGPGLGLTLGVDLATPRPGLDLTLRGERFLLSGDDVSASTAGIRVSF